MLSGLSVIAHGFNSGIGGWVSEIADAMMERPDFTGEQIRYTVTVTDPGQDGGPLSVQSALQSGPSPEAADTEDPQIVVLLDWSALAGTLSLFGSGYTRSTVDVAAAVASQLVTPGFLPGLSTPVAQLPVHLLGHSRGASLVGELARNLGEAGVRVDHVTTFDPHPVDGINEPPFVAANFGDAPMTSWNTINFWDNYWRTDGLNSFDFTGEPVANAHNVQLNEATLQTAGYPFDHSDTHLWYFGTINESTNPPANNGDHNVPNNWYGGVHPLRDSSGYFYSRDVGGARAADGVSSSLGGTAVRTAVNTAAANWPNVMNLVVDAADLQSNVGDAVDVTYYYQDVDSGATIDFYFDEDENPLNGFGTMVGQTIFNAGTGAAVVMDNIQLNTSSASAGTHRVLAKITDAGGRTRYSYAPQSVTLTRVDQIGVSRQSQFFYLDTISNGAWDKVSGGDSIFNFALPVLRNIATPIVGDWDGNGIDDLGLYNDGYFYLDTTGNGSWDTVAGGDTISFLNIGGDLSVPVPIIGDWDGNNTDDVGLYNNGLFYLDTTGNGAWDTVAGGDTIRVMNIGGNLSVPRPVVGDWDGNGVDDLGLYNQFLFYLDTTGNGAWDKVSGGDTIRFLNIGGNKNSPSPIIGDWNGDDIDDLGLFNNSYFYLDTTTNGAWDKVSGGDTIYEFVVGGDRSLNVPHIGKWPASGSGFASANAETPLAVVASQSISQITTQTALFSEERVEQQSLDLNGNQHEEQQAASSNSLGLVDEAWNASLWTDPLTNPQFTWSHESQDLPQWIENRHEVFLERLTTVRDTVHSLQEWSKKHVDQHIRDFKSAYDVSDHQWWGHNHSPQSSSRLSLVDVGLEETIRRIAEDLLGRES